MNFINKKNYCTNNYSLHINHINYLKIYNIIYIILKQNFC